LGDFIAEVGELMGVDEAVTLPKSERLVDEVAVEKMILLVAIPSIIVVANKLSRTIPQLAPSNPLLPAPSFSFRPRDDKHVSTFLAVIVSLAL
jgi:hypothetical protein